VLKVPPSCSKLLKCLRALESDKGPVGEMMGGSMGSMIEGVELWIRLGKSDSFDPAKQCAEIWGTYKTSFASMKDLEPYKGNFPSSCP
jgi:hypothetical protein